MRRSADGEGARQQTEQGSPRWAGRGVVRMAYRILYIEDNFQNKRLVRKKPMAHVRIFFKDMAHLLGLTRV